MMEFLHNLAWWHWWILAAALAALETFTPGAVAIWFGVAALVVGGLLLVAPVPWELQVVLFGVLGVVALLLWRRVKHPDGAETTDAPLNRRGVRYIGQVFTLAEPIAAGNGKVRVGDTVWLAQGGDAPAGSRVRVVGVNGTTLQVEPA